MSKTTTGAHAYRTRFDICGAEHEAGMGVGGRSGAVEGEEKVRAIAVRAAAVV